MSKIKTNDFVILTQSMENIKPHSVGLVNALNGESAMVHFVGINLTVRVDFENIECIDVTKTGKGFSHKICNMCHILKKTEVFSINQTDTKGQKTTRPSCNACRKNIDGASMPMPEKKRMDEIRPLKHSVFCCPVCEKRTIVDLTVRIVKDHDHDTGMGREWICDSCNTGLGRFKDNPDFLKSAIAYLQKFKK